MAIFVIILLAVGLGYPYWWTAILRCRMIRRLRRVCGECGFRLRPLRKLWFFARNRGDRYDLFIENKERIFAVKLWSAYRRDDRLVITKRGRIYIRRYAPIVLDVRRGAKAAKNEGREYAIPRTRLPVSQKEKRDITRILLVYPSFRAILRSDEKGESRLISGDSVFDKRLHTPSSLEGVLRSFDRSQEEKENQDTNIPEETADLK